jgi:hypothetical protein
MAYFIYKIHPLSGTQIRRLEQVGQFASFREASAEAKRLRVEPSLAEACIVKVIFADNELVAEDLLSQVREPEPMVGDDY